MLFWQSSSRTRVFPQPTSPVGYLDDSARTSRRGAPHSQRDGHEREIHLSDRRDTVISDADTGYGNAVNVTRTVRDFIEAGAAAIHIEDQEMPKKCGHYSGKTLCIPG